MDQVRHVLAAAGQFPQDDTVLARAAEIARAHRARLTIVHVIEDASGFDLAPVDMSLIQYPVRLLAQENLEPAVARLEIVVARLGIRIAIGSPSLRLIELANKTLDDLVVMRAPPGDSIL